MWRENLGTGNTKFDYFGCGFIAVLLVCTIPAWAGARIGPNDRIRVLCFGDIIDQYGGYNSFTVIQEDPAIEASFIPSRPDYLGGREDALRNMRMYMPRTREILESNHDILLFSDADSSVFRPEWIFWIEKSVTEGGLGMLWLGLIADLRFESWEETTLAVILPVQPLRDRMGAYTVSGSWRLTEIDTEEELMQSLPWMESMPLANLILQKAREGARVFARVRDDFTSGQPSGYPLMAFWDI